jgi:prepilin-type N-terminal cleavage/methylation domain-containing protein
MLKINKILLKKIQFLLSLQGLFPFCHSRESGNPSSLSLRGAKQRSNLKGFSLIELMVAVVILSIALIGIFLAFSSGWMGMANARDRTVATNYAREEMEDIKNMEFELITNENLGVAEIIEGKFNRVVTIVDEHSNLKNIKTKVFWTNRQGQYVNVETSMYINITIYNPKEASRLVLYANPYYSVLPSATETIDLIAVIKDVNGNTKIDWTGENICFTINSGSELGSLTAGASSGVETIGGIAQTIFTPSNLIIEGVVQQGNVTIEASVELPNDGGTIIDVITITVTLGVVRIELNASPISIDADGTSTSTVTAKLVDSSGGLVSDAPNEITFDISGEGTFVDSASEGSHLPDTVLMSNSGGIAIIYVESITDTPGVATVTASSAGLLSDTVNIVTTGVATSIFVSVEPNLIYEGDNATVTVEIQDINGNPVEYSGDISLAISGGTGTFVDNPVDPNNTPFAYSTFTPSSLGMLTITASREGFLEAGTTTIDVREALIANKITLKAVPKNILAGGETYSKITATIKDGTTVISNYNNPVTFEIVSDTSSPPNASLFYNLINYGTGPFTVPGEDVDNGEVVVYLIPASSVGICTVKVSTDNLIDPDPIVNTINVGFYSSEHHIRLTADPQQMLLDGNICTVTATVVDEDDTPINTYNKDITFTILVGWPKIAKFVLTGTSSLTQTILAVPGGTIDVLLISQSKAGTVTLKASSFTGMSDITGYLNIPVVSTLLELADIPYITYDDGTYEVSFDIEVQGTEINLDKMQVSWSINETLDKIVIQSPNTADPITIFENIETPALSGDIINIDDINIDDIILSTGTSNVKIYFNQGMFGKTITVIFNPNSGNYSVTVPVPET